MAISPLPMPMQLSSDTGAQTGSLAPDAEADTLAARIHARMAEAILCGEYAQGSKLPTEQELAARFGVGRSTVREALSRLRSDGIIETRRGSGSQVVAPKVAAGGSVATPPIHSLADVERFYDFRSCIEAGAAAAAADNWEEDDLRAIRAGLDALYAAMDSGQASAEADTQFHAAIVRASRNPFFITTLTTVVPVRQFVDVFSSARDQRSREQLRGTHAEHEAIYNAIARRLPHEAAQAMRVHVLNTKLRLLDSMRLF